MPEQHESAKKDNVNEEIEASETLIDDLGPNQTRLAEEDRVLTEKLSGSNFLPDAKELLHEAKIGPESDAERVVEERAQQMTRSDSLDMTG